MLFAFMAYKGQFTERMAGLIDRMVEVKMVRLHLDRLSDIALTDKENEGATAYHRDIEGNLKLDKVSFRYAMNDPMLFDGSELTVNQGESVAIIGPSGNGKTIRIFQPCKWAITRLSEIWGARFLVDKSSVFCWQERFTGSQKYYLWTRPPVI